MYTPSGDGTHFSVHKMTDARILKAAANGDLKKFQQLAVRHGDGFRKRCDVVNDCEGKRALHYAAGNGRTQICKFLIEEVKVDIDIKTERGDSPLLVAVAQRHIITAKYLIIRGAEIAMSDSKGITPLHYAAGEDNKELMQLLLLKGADIEAKSVHGTPVQFAASCGNVESVRFLLAHGASPNSVSLLSNSPIMLAISSHSSECLELLLKAGADPNLSLSGMSPLAYAAERGEAEFIQSLLRAGANANQAGTARLTPIEHAASAHNSKGVRILFPVSESIPEYPVWSLDGIIEYFHCENAMRQREQKRNADLELFKQKGKSAARRRDYSDAAQWYSKAIYLDSSDAMLLSNRSICWANLNEGAFALSDAEACVRLRPHWPKARYREGVAWMLLKNYIMASYAFFTASRLDPENQEIGDAYSEALYAMIVEFAAKYPLEAEGILENICR